MKTSILKSMKKLLVPTFATVILVGFGIEAFGQSKTPADKASALKTATAKDLTLDDIFPTDRVLDVQITLSEKDWDTIRKQSRNILNALQEKRKYEPIDGPYTYVDASVTIDGVEFPKVGLRKKGFIGSQSSTRPSLKIKLNHVNKKGEIDGLNNLTFNNNKQDDSLVSQFMGYALFNAAGSPAPRCAYAKVTVNGKNLGIYSHVETMRKPLIKRSFGNDTGTVYEGTVVDFHEGWEGSFEKKFGKDKAGRKNIRLLIKALQGQEGDTILSSNAYGRGWVPTDKRNDDKWTSVDFDDSGWKRGRNGAGYERERGYQSLISEPFDFNAKLYNKSESLYLRFPFNIDDLDRVVSSGDLVLRMKYDDGFVAYLNGHKVASSNAPKNPQWNSKAVSGHNDPEAMRFEPISISEHRNILRRGKNVLAIHGLNIDSASTDMLIVAELQTNDYDYEQAIGELVDLDSFYTFWAVEGLLGFWDGYSGNNNNFFVYLNPETDKFHFMPWGADAVFDKFSKLGYDPRAPLSVKTKGLVAHKLYQLKSGRDRYARTLLHILEKHWDEEALLAKIDRIEAMLLPHLSPSQSRRSLNQGLDKTRKFIRSRRTEIVAEISDGMPLWARIPGPPPVIPLGRNFGQDAKSIWNAAKKGNIDDLKEHLAKGTDVNARDQSGGTPLAMAALAGQSETVKFLIEKGADVNAKNNDTQTALHGAAFLGRIKVVQLLVENEADVNARNKDGQTPLDSATGEWNDAIQGFIETFLQIKIDPEKVKIDRITVATQLRKHGGKSGTDVANPTGGNIWDVAKSGNIPALKQLLSKGADVNTPDEKGITPLAWAAMAGQAEAVELLIKQGAKLNGKNRDGSTALHGAAFLGRIEVVELLIENKVEVNSRNNMRETPLGSVASEWNEQIQGITQFIATILQIKVDVEKVKSARPKIAAILRKHGGKTGDELR